MAISQSPMKKYWFGKRAGEHADGWFEFYKAVKEKGVLEKKTKELIALAVGSALRCPHCVQSHLKDALKAGASREEIAEALMVASQIASGAQLFWMAEDFEKLLGGED